MNIIVPYSTNYTLYYYGSAEGHEYPILQVGDEVNPRLFVFFFEYLNYSFLYRYSKYERKQKSKSQSLMLREPC
jgi:hypothetical protein